MGTIDVDQRKRVRWIVDDVALNLLDAILQAFDRFQTPTALPGGGFMTYCNMAVAKVLLTLGSHELRNPGGSPLDANQMVAAMSSSSNWQEVQMEDAQALANSGQVVVAGMTSQQLGQDHGHVVVVRPGTAEMSEKWQGMCPKVSHVGEKSLIGTVASWAFPGTLRPRFWQLKSLV